MPRRTKEKKRPPDTVRENIRTVADLEAKFQRQRSPADRIADLITSVSGRVTFVAAHLGWFAIWVLLNSTHVHWVRHFDPYPYILLNLLLSCEAVLLSTFVLMKQNREARRNDARDHLNLQIDLLSEREITKLLNLQIAICKRLGIREIVNQPEISALSEETPVATVAAELEEQIPDRDKA